jgi:hypothetical protein
MGEVASPATLPVKVLMGTLAGQHEAGRRPRRARLIDLPIETLGPILLLGSAAKRSNQPTDLRTVDRLTFSPEQLANLAVRQMHALADVAKAFVAIVRPDGVKGLEQPPPRSTPGPLRTIRHGAAHVLTIAMCSRCTAGAQPTSDYIAGDNRAQEGNSAGPHAIGMDHWYEIIRLSAVALQLIGAVVDEYVRWRHRRRQAGSQSVASAIPVTASGRGSTPMPGRAGRDRAVAVIQFERIGDVGAE